MPKNFSQLGQDLEVLKFYNNKRDGFFIEIGACDGIEFSNTYLLEKDYNWKGICVEPTPKKFKLLVENRPNSLCWSKPVYNTSNMDVVFDLAENHLLSGITDHIYYKHIVNTNKSQVTLKSISFSDLLEQSDSPFFIDYLSLDTEGSELEILKSVDFTKYTFGLIDVEHNYEEPRRSQIRELLTSNGYVYLRANHVDDCYKHSSL